MVKILGESESPEQGLKELEVFTKSLKSALVSWIHNDTFFIQCKEPDEATIAS